MVKRNAKGRFVTDSVSDLVLVPVRLPRSLVQQLTVAQELMDCTRTDVIRMAIGYWLSHQSDTVVLQPTEVLHSTTNYDGNTVVLQPIVPAGHGKDETRLQDSIIPDRDRRPPVGDWLNLEQISKAINDPYSIYASVMRGAYPGCNTNEGKTDRLRILGVYIDWSRYKSIRSRAFKLLGEPIDSTTAQSNGSK